MVDHLKGSFYTLFFILLNLAYLVVELSFNARVLDLSSGVSTATDFSTLEVYGRTISASGATLLAWRLLVPYHDKLNLSRMVIKFFVIGLVVFPLVFIGQKKIVDELVNQSSAETRRSAEILTLLKYGIANGFVEIDELALDELTLLSAEGKMFITLSGLLAYNSKHMLDVLERELEKIAGYAMATEKRQVSIRQYRNYQYVREQILERYQEYLHQVNQLEQNQAEAYATAVEFYESAMNTGLDAWVRYLKNVEDYPSIDQVPLEQVAQLHYLLQTSEQRLKQCDSEACIDEGLNQLQIRLAKNLGIFSDWTDWCRSGQGEQPLHCIDDKAVLHTRIIEVRYSSVATIAGLSRVYPDQLAYLQSEDMRERVFESFQEQGVQLDQSVKFEDFNLILQAIADQLEKQYRRTYDEKLIEAFGDSLPPRSDVESFVRLPSMQALFSQALQQQTTDQVAMDLDQLQFEDQLLAPLYFQRYSVLIEKLRADDDWYATGAPYEESGKNSVRNLVVPPVVIAFSMVFGLLNLINLVLTFVFLFIRESLRLRWLGTVILSVLVLLMPLQHDYRIYNQAAYLDLLQETEANYGYWAQGLDWVARTEPLLYPLANVLRYNLLNGFSFD